MRVAFVVQRYGDEVVGGSERLAMDYAERLYLRGWDVAVYTTTAVDYMTWENFYPEGEFILRGVKVKRYRVERTRDINEFNRHSEKFFSQERSEEEEEEWLHLQGPVVPALIDALEKEQKEYDLFIFFTYLYYPTYYGLQVVDREKFLFPTAHDEVPFYMGIMNKVFKIPDVLLFLTEEERKLVDRVYPAENQKRVVLGAGIEPPEVVRPSMFREYFGIHPPFYIYVGRIDEGKGCGVLIDYFSKYAYRNVGQLILAGKLNMKLPDIPFIRYIGFLPEQVKWDALAAASVSIHPSQFESFSYSVLESMAVGTPVLVNKASAVMLDHVLKSGAGLYYEDYYTFQEALEELSFNQELYEKMALKGALYVMENYSWSRVLTKLFQLL